MSKKTTQENIYRLTVHFDDGHVYHWPNLNTSLIGCSYSSCIAQLLQCGEGDALVGSASISRVIAYVDGERSE